ncbi:MAG: NAD(P)(+) transhydrogenase (Re/Si-specific) subunit beta [Actinomycetota bacterium]|nr:NAD(P)(+) transhydrogenase (Re/Si-specific) subunit beta [Actinomycetota bacterium]MDK1017008.1 NAD(P)(+) transhydrogenase (Re/Si-specific) subunit beta [Actinomycetota bacterium]MDK1097506.1 NAD(P)(+) transhydrogenase (Re/Si-specific) subunit beta [Actinomycetota bacterium]MDK1103550.1 NAD(P)(+) transhydrogenase (Re/Si-specific) subunit beta [Actinomycetota bacterium]
MVELAYLTAGVLFIVGLKGLTSPKTATRGIRIAAVGMLVAMIVVTFDLLGLDAKFAWGVVIAGVVVGGAIGAVLAIRVQMTDMPQLVAAFNGFGGGASALVAAATVVGANAVLLTETAVVTSLSLAIGTVTLTGSFVAFGKLQGIISGRQVFIPGGAVTNGVIAAGIVAASAVGVFADSSMAYWVALGLAAVLGVTTVLVVGGADMPVVISLLNSFSGIAAAMAGFIIGNQALIVGGALVGAAGMILTIEMATAMNRSIPSILFAQFGGGASAEDIGTKPVNRATADDAAIALAYAERVIIVPGYGLAVAQAQHAVKDLANALEERGIEVTYAIHPVAGRMPGHMNVLLAEADISYDLLLDLEQANPKFAQTDVVLVIGANDVVNPSAKTDPTSPIYGMPILNVDEAKTTIVVKRSLSPGFAGIDNPLFYEDTTLMFFGDAKQALEDALAAINQL